MSLYTLYIVTGIIAGIAAAYAMWQQVARRISERARHTLALERNTEVTEALNVHIEKLTDKLHDHDKRLDRVEYKLFGFDRAS